MSLKIRKPCPDAGVDQSNQVSAPPPRRRPRTNRRRGSGPSADCQPCRQRGRTRPSLCDSGRPPSVTEPLTRVTGMVSGPSSSVQPAIASATQTTAIEPTAETSRLLTSYGSNDVENREERPNWIESRQGSLTCVQRSLTSVRRPRTNLKAGRPAAAAPADRIFLPVLTRCRSGTGILFEEVFELGHSSGQILLKLLGLKAGSADQFDGCRRDRLDDIEYFLNGGRRRARIGVKQAGVSAPGTPSNA